MSRRALVPPQQTQEAILVAAERLFREIGYVKTTIADIAEALGMSSANVYRFFPSKSAINNAICERMIGTILDAMRAAVAAPGPASARLAAMIHSGARLTGELLTDERRVFDMVEAAMTENWDAIAAHIEAVDALAAEVIAQGIADGEFGPGDPSALADGAMTACGALLHPSMIAQCADEPDRDRSIARAVWLIVEGLRNKDRSPMP
jgi:AcrR family transcriptional regulator